MTERDMADLLRIHDAVEDLSQLTGKLTGQDFAHGFGEGILGELTYVTQVIVRNSPIWDKAKDFESQEIGRVLNARGDYEERARKLLGIS